MVSYRIIFSLAAFAAMGSASFTKPEADGIYVVSIDADGAEYHEHVAPLNQTLVDSIKAGTHVSRHAKRGYPNDFPKGSYATCGSTIETVPSLDWSIADEHFADASCPSGSTTHLKGDGGHKAVVAVSNGISVFMCSYSKKGNPCNTDEYNGAKSAIRGQCNAGDGGAIQSGWYTIPGWKKSYGWTGSSSFC
ncbi:hypothetical protein F4779DRAFT_555685 [Xylariaceae sp. FL0662B]|nr:hypothetical protein F4779DRAFT_555685 [Xylariaceae sp. FL0662B]